MEQIAQLDVIAAEMTSQFKESNEKYVPVVGEACAALYSNFHQYYRCVVLKVNEEEGEAEVRFIDYGNKTIVKFHEIVPLPKEYIDLPQQAVHFSLYEKKQNWPEECITGIDSCTSLVGSIFTLFVIFHWLNKFLLFSQVCKR